MVAVLRDKLLASAARKFYRNDMVAKVSMADILQLTASERIRLVEDIWDSIAEAPEAVQLTDAQRVELDARLDEHRRNPGDAIPWDEVKKRLRRG